MKTAFVTEMGFNGKISLDHPNARTEFAWMATLESDHFNVYQYEIIKGYDAVFVILPKGKVKLNRVGAELHDPSPDHDMPIYSKPIIQILKENNKKVCYVQEGPNNFFNDYTLDNQFHFYNQISICDIIFAHNRSDIKYYKGMFPNIKVTKIPTLMLDTLLNDIDVNRSNKVLVGGNMAYWYGGFQSYILSDIFEDCEKWVHTSHCKQRGEEDIPDLNHIPRLSWIDWMKELSTFKYAVHMMPTVAAGTLALNCAYFGIPCIGNIKVDTQYDLFPHLSVDIDNMERARSIAEALLDGNVYKMYSDMAVDLCRKSHYFDRKKWLEYMEEALSD